MPRIKKLLPGKRYHATQMCTGKPKWGKKEWIGKLYPDKTKEKDFLENYIQHYNSIEQNVTHYKLYDAEQIGKWASKAKETYFKFCAKIKDSISHYSGFNSASENLQNFYYYI
jgi:uncharacterized protein YecE (DUF72 family)